jgi:hypothetical protein
VVTSTSGSGFSCLSARAARVAAPVDRRDCQFGFCFNLPCRLPASLTVSWQLGRQCDHRQALRSQHRTCVCQAQGREDQEILFCREMTWYLPPPAGRISNGSSNRAGEDGLCRSGLQHSHRECRRAVLPSPARERKQFKSSQGRKYPAPACNDGVREWDGWGFSSTIGLERISGVPPRENTVLTPWIVTKQDDGADNEIEGVKLLAILDTCSTAVHDRTKFDNGQRRSIAPC